MKHKKLLALCGATIVLGLLAAPAVGAIGPAVTVRVEGVAKTLELPTTVRPGSGSVTRYGAPKGSCPAKSAAGALDLATRHKWKGVWSTSFEDYEITSILGETHSFTSKSFWEIFVNNVAAASGACGIKLHRGDQLLFAAVPLTGTAYPLGLQGPSRARVGGTATVKVVWFTGPSGRAKPLRGAHISGSGVSATSDAHGLAHIHITHTGTLELKASKRGYVRSAPLRIAELP